MGETYWNDTFINSITDNQLNQIKDNIDSGKKIEKTIKQKIKIESFRDYLRMITKSIDEGNHNDKLLDDICETIDNYYKKNKIDSDTSDNDSINFIESDTEEAKSPVDNLEEVKIIVNNPEETKSPVNNPETKTNEKKKDKHYIPFLINDHNLEKKLVNPYSEGYTINTHINRFINLYKNY
jgi:hypothetical protein